MKHLIIIIAALALLTACTGRDRQEEISRRRAALTQHQDSALKATQQELEVVDRELQAAQKAYQQLQDELSAGKAGKARLAQLQQELTQARLHRDSMQVRFDVLCGKIRYIHRRQEESKELKKTNTEANQPPTQR